MRYLFLLVLLSGCYGLKKATVQHGKAVATYPELGADYCARIYPSKDSIIKGDSIITFDTLWQDGEIHFDTIYSRLRDTVFITQFTPGKTVFQTIWAVDTIFQTNTAALDLCSIERGKAITLLEAKTAESDKWKKIAKKRFWIILAMGAGIALGIFVAFRKKLIKQVT